MTIADLTKAIDEQNEQKVKEILARDKSIVNDRNKDGMTPLAVAASIEFDENIISMLVKNGADINKECKGGPFNGFRPIDIAAENHESFDNLEKLIKLGAKVDEKVLNKAMTEEAKGIICKAPQLGSLSTSACKLVKQHVAVRSRSGSTVSNGSENAHLAPLARIGHYGGKRGTKRKARSTKRKARKTRR
jgi:ankyrin repeat protein